MLNGEYQEAKALSTPESGPNPQSYYPPMAVHISLIKYEIGGD
jgi:hypothetical protein